MRVVAYAFLALAIAADTARAQSPALDAAVRAMGGRERLLAVRTLVLEGTGETLNFGQNHTPFAESRFEVTAYRRAYDFAGKRWFQDLTRVPRFTTASAAPQRLRIGLDAATDTVGYNIGANDVMARATAQLAADRLHEFILHPVGFVQAALAAGAEVSEESAAAGVRRVRLSRAGARYSMFVDSATSLPVRTERLVYQSMLGDVALVTELGDWRPVSGLQLPMRLTQKYENLFTLADLRLSAAQVNGATGNLAATDSVRAAVLPSAPAAPAIVVDTIAPGVWAVAGQSHHTIVIEQADQLVLVEAPQTEARTLAAIDAARALRPDKPATLLINTHHHFDHAGGIRAAIAQGLTIVTHDANRDFYERVLFPRRHSIQQDRLAQNPKPMRLMPVTDRWVRPDSVRRIEVYAAPSDHAGSMLIVYLPAERILVQADLYNPPGPTAVNPVFPFAKALVETVGRRGLTVDRVVGIHGRPVPWSDVVAASQR